MPARHEHLLTMPGGALAAGQAHPDYTAAAGTALAAALVGWALTAFPPRKRIIWAVDLDLPVGLTTSRAPGADWAVTFPERGPQLAEPDPREAEEAWLVLVTVTNTGLAPVRGRDFPLPLAFRFAGREVYEVSVCPDPSSLRPGRLPPALPTVTSTPGGSVASAPGHASGVVLDRELLLHRNGTFKLLALLGGAPSDDLPPVSQEGSLAGGSIVADRPDGPSFRKWGTACAVAAVLLAAVLLGMFLGAG